MSVPNPDEILFNLLSDLEAGFAKIGSEVPLNPGSQLYVIANAFSNSLASAFANQQVLFDNAFVESATGEDLDRHLVSYGLSRRGAVAALGSFVLTSAFPTNVANGTELIASSSGEIFQVVNPGVKANGDRISIVAKNPGPGGNLKEGTILKWSTVPAGVAPSVTLVTPCSGGAPSETDALCRERLKQVLGNSPSGENWAEIAKQSESFSDLVQKAFVYPCYSGPSTCLISLISSPNLVTKSRVLDSSTLNSLQNAIASSVLVGNDVVVRSVEDVGVDIGFILDAPVYPSKVGFVDINPYPVVATGESVCKVTSVISPTSIVVKSKTGSSPVNLLTSVSWIDSTFVVRTAVVVSSSIVGDLHTLVLDSPFTGVAINDVIFPSLVNCDKYLASVLDWFSTVGPGEVTSSVLRALRKPLPSNSFPSSIDGSLLKKLVENHVEIKQADYCFRSSTTPSLPLLINNPPKIFIPRKLSFYPKKD